MITRWDTWIFAVINYSENFQNIRQIVESFDENDAFSIKNPQKYI